MKVKRIPTVGFYLLIISLLLLVVAYFVSISTFQLYGYSVDRYVIIFPLFAIWIIGIQVVMSFIDINKPLWTHAIDLAFALLVIFAFAHTLMPFLSIIGVYFTVGNMGDVATNAIGVPRCLTACILYIVSTLVFVVASFFKIVNFKEVEQQ